MSKKDMTFVYVGMGIYALIKVVALISAAWIAVHANLWVGSILFVAALLHRIWFQWKPSKNEEPEKA